VRDWVKRALTFQHKDNVLHAQAYGCWLYCQFGEHAYYFGARMPVGLRVEWHDGVRRVSFRRHDKSRIYKPQPISY